jgi:DnaJ-class molecular chaperone
MVEGKDHGAMASGDEAPPGERSAGEDVCEACSGSGRIDGDRCEECGGTGRVERAVGGG